MLAALKSPAVIALAIVMLLGATGASLKLHFFGLTDSSDYQEYVATARYIAGESGAEPVPHRFLKPLLPLILAGMGVFLDYQSAMIVFAVVCYFILILAMFLLAKEFFDTFRSALITSLAALSYPVLKYGIEINAETGALAMYVVSLWLTLLFLKQPTRTIFIWNVALITIGFLYKEYSIVAAIIFGLSILFHPALTTQSKALYVAAYGTIFLAVHIPWQVFVYMTENYSYLSWYSFNATTGYEQGEFTLRTFTKSTAALLGLAWLLVPFGLMRFKSFAPLQKRFLQVAIAPPFIGYLWGYIQSRLLYVMAPPFLLVAGMGMLGWRRSTQVIFVAMTIVANVAWLFLSYQITL